MAKKTAFLLTDRKLATTNGKTAHGLILGSCRYEILAVIDSAHAGKDAGEVIDGQHRAIPIFANIESAITTLQQKPDFVVISFAPHGGKFTPSLVETIKEALIQGVSVVNGLHSLVSEDDELAALADQYQCDIIDIRKPKSIDELHAWEGEIAKVRTPRIAVLGTDCAIGKRSTCYQLLELCHTQSINVEMIYTGQTGWLQGLDYGFIFDATLNDFVSGELEHHILRCIAEKNPELILVEGQSSLRNPSGPCGAEMLLSAGAKYVILQHIPGREYFCTDSHKSYKIPSLSSEIELIKFYGAEVIAVTLNTNELGDSALPTLDIPVICPRREGVSALLPLIKKIIESENEN